MSGTAPVATYVDSDTEVLSASNGVEYAYRVTGTSDAPPLVTLQHFRGNLDSWDPALIDALAAGRRVITFDNRGVAATSGRTPSTMAQMALDAIDFIDALDIGEVDLLGFSIGSFLAQEIALIRPASVRKVVLASSAPKGASGMHGWAPAVIGAVGKPETSGEEYLLERVSAIHKPVFVANGDSDPMILPRYSYLLAGLIPGARLKIYPDSAHGFLFQHHAQFAADVDAFLASA